MKKKQAVCICAAVIALSAAYLTFENEALMLTEHDFVSEKVSEPFDGFKICHLSDIHVKSNKKSYSRLIGMVTDASPDIIVISGDLVDSRVTLVPSALSLVEKLTKIAPVYYVTGNHEERLPPEIHERIVDGLTALGVHIMNGVAETIERGGEVINIAGLFDEDHFYVTTAAELFDEDVLNILINHRPQFAEDYAKAGADLTFTGHAHGGQMRIPFVGGVIAPDQYFFPEFYEGVHYYGDRATVISRGIGNSLCPFRVNNRPEVIVVTLRKAE